MQVILLERVENLGAIGDEVKVKNGFARNFLLPQGKALMPMTATAPVSSVNAMPSKPATPKPAQTLKPNPKSSTVPSSS